MSPEQLMDALDDTSWRNAEPPGPLPERFCQGPEDHPEDHTPHTWWQPTYVATRVFGPQVQRILEVTWYQCAGKVPAARRRGGAL